MSLHQKKFRVLTHYVYSLGFFSVFFFVDEEEEIFLEGSRHPKKKIHLKTKVDTFIITPLLCCAVLWCSNEEEEEAILLLL